MNVESIICLGIMLMMFQIPIIIEETEEGSNRDGK